MDDEVRRAILERVAPGETVTDWFDLTGIDGEARPGYGVGLTSRALYLAAVQRSPGRMQRVRYRSIRRLEVRRYWWFWTRITIGYTLYPHQPMDAEGNLWVRNFVLRRPQGPQLARLIRDRAAL